jgi:hypothetical protein
VLIFFFILGIINSEHANLFQNLALRGSNNCVKWISVPKKESKTPCLFHPPEKKIGASHVHVEPSHWSLEIFIPSPFLAWPNNPS